uniref:ADP-ribosylation factor-like protein 2-binding protein n=1 Tax=Zonotrichia albicollis TaxID=44394 RepID=A0A8D2N4Q5_ZONAL
MQVTLDPRCLCGPGTKCLYFGKDVNALENFAPDSLPCSWCWAEGFDAVVGYLEDIIMDDDFQLIQRNFLEKHYQEFDDSEENKLIYTDIFNEYISLVEKYIEEKLLDRIRGFDMVAFTVSLQ